MPSYDALGVPVNAILTDNGREFCSKPESHPYELLLSTQDDERRNTKVRSRALKCAETYGLAKQSLESARWRPPQVVL